MTVLQVVESAPIKKSEGIKRRDLLNTSAPVASSINGAHLLLLNDVDSSTTKNAFVLLSEPRDYYDGMSACDSMGDGEWGFFLFFVKLHLTS